MMKAKRCNKKKSKLLKKKALKIKMMITRLYLIYDKG